MTEHATPTDRMAAARTFLQRDGRLLERRLAATLFDSAPADGVVAALAAYRNRDGGFGHALEPDTRCPDSLGVDAEFALVTLHQASASSTEMVDALCDHLEGVAAPDGAIALATPVIEGYPRAAHATAWMYEPGLFPTAGVVGVLHALGVTHPWLTRARAWCWSALEAGMPQEAHRLGEALVFLEHVEDRQRARALLPAVADALATATLYAEDPDDESYGVTPLDLAPRPDAVGRPLFDDGLIDAHLDRLAAAQQPDGGWPISWEPPSATAVLEWRGIVTVRALCTLTAYGR